MDVTILTIDGGIFEVQSTSGNTQLGGQVRFLPPSLFQLDSTNLKDIDNRIFGHLLSVCKEAGVDPTSNPRAMKRLKDQCVKVTCAW